MKPVIYYAIVTEPEHMSDVEELQRQVWGNQAITPLAQLVAAIHNGGVVIGAYDQDQLVGFCYGFAGYKNGEASLCSHMMAIDPEYRDLGIGYQLKHKQRIWAIDYGYKKIIWTFDPLETRNAYLNLCKLGGTIRTYLPAYYGDLADEVNKGLPSDRFLVEWELESVRAVDAAAGKSITSERWQSYPSLVKWLQSGSFARPVLGQTLGYENEYIIPVPRYLHDMKRDQIDLAKEWRFILRNQFQHALANGYVVTGLLRSEDPVHYYVVEKMTV